jgi:hypothetical protein
VQYITENKILLPLIFLAYFLTACNDSVATVKGPIFSVEVALSEKAEKKLTKLNEKIIISNMFSGTRAIPSKEAEYPTKIELNNSETEINIGETAYFKSIVFNQDDFEKVKFDADKEREHELNINIFSARRAYKDNLLSCSLLMEDVWVIRNKHIRIWCSLIDEKYSPMKSEIIGKEKEKYDSALQRCFDKYEKMNNTVLASCKEEVSNEFKGTEREHLEAPKLEGLIDIEGSYARQDDVWNFSLDESVGFHLIHTVKGQSDDVLIAEDLELIEGNRYSIYVENMYGDTDPKWALVFNPETKYYDLEVKTYSQTSNKWESLMYSGS